MAATFSVTERIGHIDSLDDALPFLKALPLDIIKTFLSSSAKHGFFDDLIDLKWDGLTEDDESPTNPLSVDNTDFADDEDTESSKDSLQQCLSTAAQPSQEWSNEILCAGYNRLHCDKSIPLELHNLIQQFTICDLKEGDAITFQSSFGEIWESGLIRCIAIHSRFGDEVICIELDIKSPNGGDGSINGQPLFHTDPGRAFFIPHRDVTHLNLDCGLVDGDYAQLQGLNRSSRFNGRIVRIVHYVPRNSRWKTRHFGSKEEHRNTRNLAVRERSLCPISYWKAVIQSTHSESSIAMPCIGERVRTKQGLIGTVSYIGIEYIGLTLDEWNLNGNDGRLDEESCFSVENGYGYFVKLKDLVEIIDVK